MKKTRRVLLFSVGLALMVGMVLCPVAAPGDAAASGTPVAAVGQPANDKGQEECSCACSPLAGAWVAKLTPEEGKKTDTPVDGKGDKDWKSKKVKRIFQTFKFVPVNDTCDRFAVNAQALVRPLKAIYAFPEVTDLSEFVGLACKTEAGKIDFTAVGYGLERTDEEDCVVLIAVLSGTIAWPDGYGKNADSEPQCYEPEELSAALTVTYYDVKQDEDGDGFPDKGEKAVVCLSYEAQLKRVKLEPPCPPTKPPAVTAAADGQG